MAETKHHEHHKPKKQINIWKILSLVLIIVLCISLFFLLGGGATSGMAIIDPEEAAKNATDFINEYLVQPGTEASIVSVEESSGIYNVTLLYQENEIPVYVTRDGKYVFLAAPVDLTEEMEETEETQEQPTEVVKTDRPEAHAFVMSYCPYGLQFLKAYVPVIELLGDKANLEVNFVHYIMHGEKEATENTRMYCIQKEQNNKFTDYLRCFVESNDADACISSVGIDETSLNTCMQDTDEQFEITKTIQESQETYPSYAVDAVLAQAYGVGGSPTFVLNGVTLSVDRAAESIKQAICNAFNNPPAECDQTLSTTAESPGAGPIGAGSGSGSSGTC